MVRRPQAPAAVLDVDDADGLWAASRALDEGDGVVWVGDDRGGPRGAARHLRRVRDRDEARAAGASLRSACDRVRVMPFLEGVPCGATGWVLPSGVAVGRALEMLVLRDGPRMRYCGCASYWDPPEDAHRQHLDAVRRVGERLAADLGYRGAFGVDGIVTRRGFVPTEINTRSGGGATVVGGLDERLLLDLLSAVLAAGGGAGVPAPALEAAVQRLCADQRVGYAGIRVEQPWQGDTAHPVAWRDGAYHPAGDAPPDGTLWAHAMQPVGFLRFVPELAHVRGGAPFAPRVAEALVLADALLGTAFGRMQAAAAVR
ncbi:MAG: hypothetical protein R3F59_28915 [Myxococcota bacterium]